MQTLEALLAEHPFVKALEPQYLHFVASCASNVHYDSETYIFREGEPAAYFYILREGKVALETFATERGTIILETIEAGDVLGWSWLFSPYHWHFSARAIEPVQAIALDGIKLRNKSEEDHDFGYNLIKQVAQIMLRRLQATRLQLLDMYTIRA